MATSPFFAEMPVKGIESASISGEDAVPVDRITSFNGVLNKYVHVSEASAASSSSQETKRQLDTTAETQVTPKRRRPHTASAASAASARMSPASTITPRITRSKSRSLTPATPPSLTSKSPSQLQSGSATPSKSPGTPRQRSRSAGRRQTSSPASLPTSLLRDTIPPNLTLLLVGVNPGIKTGETGYAYAHPSNLFWKLLHSSGLTAVRHPPSDTYKLPELYNIGNTNIVERPTRDASMLSKAEMDAGVPILEAKIADKKPECVCLVGKSIWESVWRAKKGRPIKKEEFRYGWQDAEENMGRSEEWEGARVFVATTTSGLAAGMSMAEKQAVWNELGTWFLERRRASSSAHTQAGPEIEAQTQVDADSEAQTAAHA